MVTAEPPAAERAYLLTKDLILSGQLAAGALLSEGEIAARLSLSRTPVREAFLRLETEELLRLIPKRGAVVVPVPATEAADILDVRLALESASARRLAGHAGLSGVVSELEALITRQVAATRDRDVETFAQLDQLFHSGIVTLAGNALMTKFYATLADRQRRMTVGALGLRPEKLKRLVKEHRSLLDRIAGRDPDGFTLLLAEHLTSTHGIATGARS